MQKTRSRASILACGVTMFSGVIRMTECAGDRGFVAPLAHFLRPLGVSVWSGRERYNVNAGEAVATRVSAVSHSSSLLTTY